MLTLTKFIKLLILCLLLLLTACGGGGSASPKPDTTPPVIALNGASSISLYIDETYEELGASATDNIDGSVTIVISGTVDTSILGDYIVTYTATDNAGNTNSVTRKITVVELPDTTAPVITLNGDSEITLFQNEDYTELGATATDNKDGALDVVISGSVDTSILGDYIVTYTATDKTGNTNSVTRTVSVIEPPDTIPPVITLNGASTISLLIDDTYDELGATATDDRDGVVEVTISGIVDTTIAGSYTITYTASDSSGNTNSVVRNVIITLNRPFITTWKTNTEIHNGFASNDYQIKITTNHIFYNETTGYDYLVEWGDGTFDEHVTGDITHTYAAAGTYTVAISGSFPALYYGGYYYDGQGNNIYISDQEKLQTIE